MKYFLQNWKPEYDGILYFFHRVQEMLFHYSDDIVRAPIHNTKTLINEYLENEAEMQKNNVTSYQIEQILSELCYSLQHDRILVQNLGEDFIQTINEKIKTDTKDIITYLNSKFPHQTYYKWCINYLREHILQHKHKKEIEFATRVWIVEVVSNGYSPEYIYTYLSNKMSKPIAEPENFFNEFIDNFSFNYHLFRVYFQFSPQILECKELFKTRIGVEFNDDGNFNLLKKRKNDFIGYVEVKALDRYNASFSAYNKVSIFVKYYKTLTNRIDELIRPHSFVKDVNTLELNIVPVKPKGYRSYKPEPTTEFKDSVDTIILSCQNKKNARKSINKMITLHNVAIQQDDLNDGFLNFWSILEIISSDICCKAKIEKVIKAVVPTLEKDYFTSVLSNIEDDLKHNLNKSDYTALIDLTQTDDSLELNYICRFIFLTEFEELRDSYFKKLENFPVIRTKIYNLWELRNSKQDLMKLSKKYAQRVTWHIYRLYRTRNSIVHSGETHPRIQALGEHLHIYVDQIMMEIIVKLLEEKTLHTISDVLTDTSLFMLKKEKHFNIPSSINEDDLILLCNSYFYESNNTDL